MSSIFESVLQQLGGDKLGQISGALGADERTTGTATAAAVTTLLGALSRNAAKDDGAQALHQALQKDHDGSLLENLGGFLGQPEQGAGDGILRHVLGERRPQVEAGLSKTTGLDAGSVGKLLTMVAPVVMAALGRQQREANLDTSALSNLLGQEQRQVARAHPETAGLLGTLLDTDGDGDFDIKDGIRTLGKLFGK